MNWFCKAAKMTLFILALGAWFFSPPASGQTQQAMSSPAPQPKEANTDQGVHVDITPYLWFAGVHGTAGALGHDTSVHASTNEPRRLSPYWSHGTRES